MCMETHHYVPERRDSSQRSGRKTRVLALGTRRTAPYLTKSFPWKQEDTVYPRVDRGLRVRITTGALKIQIPGLYLRFSKSEALGGFGGRGVKICMIKNLELRAWALESERLSFHPNSVTSVSPGKLLAVCRTGLILVSIPYGHSEGSIS